MAREDIGRNLRRLRKAKGMTQEQLATAAGISRPGYRNLETGESVPRVDTLQALAGSLGVKLAALVTPVTELRHVRFRSLRRLNTREQILADVSRWLSDFNELENLLPDREVYTLASHAVAGRGTGLGRARNAAVGVRTVFGVGDEEPIRDVCGLLEAKGIKVFSITLATNEFFGLSVGPGDGGPAIVVNTWERISVERWIFTAAHELGHLVLHADDYGADTMQEEEQSEQEANVFAACFLMPEGTFSKKWAETAGLPLVERVLKVKRIFRVSYKTVLYRLSQQVKQDVNVWHLFQKEYRRETGRTLLRDEEPEALAASAYQASFPEASRAGEPDVLSRSDFREDRLSRLVRKAVETGAISLSRGAEILRLPLKDMRELSKVWVERL